MYIYIYIYTIDWRNTVGNLVEFAVINAKPALGAPPEVL